MKLYEIDEIDEIDGTSFSHYVTDDLSRTLRSIANKYCLLFYRDVIKIQTMKVWRDSRPPFLFYEDVSRFRWRRTEVFEESPMICGSSDISIRRSKII